MKLHIEVSGEKMSEIKYNLNKMMSFKDKTIFVISKAEFIEEDVIVSGGWFGKDKIVRKLYLTEINLYIYNDEFKDTRTFTEETAFSSFIKINDFNKCRRNWNDLKVMLDAFGCEVVATKSSTNVVIK